MYLKHGTGALAALLLIATTASAAPPSSTAPLPGTPAPSSSHALPVTLDVSPFEMRYRVLRDGWHLGNAVFSLHPAGSGTWLFKSRANASGLASLFVHSNFGEQSHFTLHSGQLRPLSYRYTDSGNPKHDEHVKFDWARNIAHDTRGGNTKQVSIRPGVLDRLSAQLSLSRRLSAGLALPKELSIVKGGKVRHYHFTRKGKDLVATPAGDFETVVVSREDPQSKRRTIFWLAPRYQWLPVKMQQREPGKATITFVLAKLTWLKTQ